MLALRNELIENKLTKRFYIWTSVTSLIISLILILIIFFLFRYLPPRLPLFYSFSWGESQLASHYQFYIIPLSIILITFINLLISAQLHSSQLFFKKGLLLSSLVITTILTITIIKIVFVFV